VEITLESDKSKLQQLVNQFGDTQISPQEDEDDLLAMMDAANQ